MEKFYLKITGVDLYWKGPDLGSTSSIFDAYEYTEDTISNFGYICLSNGTITRVPISQVRGGGAATSQKGAVKMDVSNEQTQTEMKKKTARVPLHLVCPAGVAHEAMAMKDGYLKYGHASFLLPEVKMSAVGCLGAALRHIERLLAGEDYAPEENGAHHAGHARAMLGIYLECMEAGVLIDDRVAKRDYIGPMFDRMVAK